MSLFLISIFFSLIITPHTKHNGDPFQFFGGSTRKKEKILINTTPISICELYDDAFQNYCSECSWRRLIFGNHWVFFFIFLFHCRTFFNCHTATVQKKKKKIVDSFIECFNALWHTPSTCINKRKPNWEIWVLMVVSLMDLRIFPFSDSPANRLR